MATKAASAKTASKTATKPNLKVVTTSPSPSPASSPVSKKAVSKAKTPKAAFTATQIVMLHKDTSGALAYKAIDSKGNFIGQDDTALSQIYLRKAKTVGMPKYMEITVKEVSGPSAKSKPAATDESEED